MIFVVSISAVYMPIYHKSHKGLADGWCPSSTFFQWLVQIAFRCPPCGPRTQGANGLVLSVLQIICTWITDPVFWVLHLIHSLGYIYSWKRPKLCWWTCCCMQNADKYGKKRQSKNVRTLKENSSYLCSLECFVSCWCYCHSLSVFGFACPK